MKFNYFLGAAAIAMAMTACTAEQDIKTNVPGTEGNGDGYMSISIKLPTQNGTRANDVFDHGEGDGAEYAVNNSYLVLYNGTSEADAKFVSAYDISTMEGPKEHNGMDNITTTYRKAVKVKGIPADGNLYGLVLINVPAGKIAIESNNSKLEFNGKTYVAGSGATFKSLAEDIISSGYYTVNKDGYATNIFMTNAPAWTKVGGGTDPKGGQLQVLAPLAKNFKSTEKEALEEVAGSIFVERLVAKASLTVNATVAQIDDTHSVAIKVVEWALGNTEPTSYVARNVDGFSTWVSYLSDEKIKNGDEEEDITNPYRFVGHNQFGKTEWQDPVSLYRTYFCKDPQWDAPATLQDVGDFVKSNKPLYCYENTFDVAHQSYFNTTYATFKVQYNNGETFYTVNDDQTTLYTEENAIKFVKEIVANTEAVKQAFIRAKKEDASLKNFDYTKYFDVTLTPDAETGIQNLSAITLKAVTGADADLFQSTPAFLDGEEDQIISNFNGAYDLRKYADGWGYYKVMIKHFGDDLTPWNLTGTRDTILLSYGEAGEARDKKYLGRYGMVRNNWYDLTIESVKNLGSPVLPKLTDLPDDNHIEDKYIGVKVNVLSWAKRTQNITL